MIRDFVMRRRFKEPFDEEVAVPVGSNDVTPRTEMEPDIRQRLSRFEESFESTSSRVAELSDVVQALRKEAPQREFSAKLRSTG